MSSCPPDASLCIKAFTSSPSIVWNKADAHPSYFTNLKPWVLLLYLLDQADNGIVHRADIYRDVEPPQRDRKKADKSINDILDDMRKKFTADFLAHNAGGVITLSIERVSYWMDTREIDSIYPVAQQIMHILQQKECSVNIEDEKRLYSALGLYGAPFFAGFTPKKGSGIGPWVEKRRNDLRMKVCAVLLALLNILIRRELYAEALDNLKRLDAIDPALLDRQCGHYWLWLASRFPDQDWYRRGFELLRREAWDPKVLIPTEAVWEDCWERVKSDRWEPNLQFLWFGRVERERGGWQLRPETIDLINDIKRAVSSKTTRDTVFNITGASRGIGKSYMIEKVRDRLKAADLNVAYINPVDGMVEEAILLSVIEQLGMTDQVNGLNTFQLQHQFKQELELKAGARRCVIILDGLSARSIKAEALCEMFKGAVLVLVFDAPSLKLSQEYAQEKDFFTRYHEVAPIDLSKVEDFLQAFGVPITQTKPESRLWNRVLAVTGGLPLTLEVLASIVKAHHAQRPESFWGALPREMTRLGGEDVPYHIRFLRWVFSEKRKLLIWRSSLKVLHAAALFAPEMPISEQDLADVIAGVADEGDIKTLKDYHLLKPFGGGYRLHGLVRDFILSQTPLPSYHAKLRSAYTDHIQRKLEECLGEDGVEDNMTAIDALRGDMLQTFDRLLEDGLSVRSIRLLVRLYDYFDRRGMYDYADKLYDSALQHPTAQEPSLRFDLLAARGRIRLKQGNRPKAVEDFEAAHRLLPSVDEAFKRVELYRDLGRAMMVRGGYTTALHNLQMGLKEYDAHLAVTDAQPHLRAWLASLHIYLNLGVIYQERGAYDTADAMVEKVLQDKRLGEPYTYDTLIITQFAKTLIGLIKMERPDGDLRIAIGHMKGALELAKDMRHPERIARAMLNLGVIHYWSNQLKQAQAYFTEGLNIIAATGHQELTAWLTFNRGMAYLVPDPADIPMAGQMLSRAEQIVDAENFNHILPHLDIGFGIFHMTVGRADKAEECFTKVLRRVGVLKDSHQYAAKTPSEEINPQIILRALYGWVLTYESVSHPKDLPKMLRAALVNYRQFRGVELTAEFEHAQTYFGYFFRGKTAHSNLPDLLDKFAYSNIEITQR